ncbi:MAG: polysaccharide biosynthesis/export family protein, partial [Thermomicrobiales bacterium]
MKYLSLSRICTLLVLLILGACTTLPSEGPERAEIEQDYKSKNTAGFALIDVDQTVAEYLALNYIESFGDRFGKGKPTKGDLIGVGDILTVMIWEADPQGLFASMGTVNRGTIPDIEVSARGTIHVPYAGTIKAVGRTPEGLAQTITKALETKTVEPQVHVVRNNKVASVVTVSGGVQRPGIYPLSLRGDTLLDVIATAGGSTFAAHDTVVKLTRRGKVASSYLDHILETPEDNIYLRTGDLVSIELLKRTYSVFGAVERKGNIEFGKSRLNLMEAVSKAYGLNTFRADAKGLYLFRYELRTTAERLSGGPVKAEGEMVPVIYRLDLKDP